MKNFLMIAACLIASSVVANATTIRGSQSTVVADQTESNGTGSGVETPRSMGQCDPYVEPCKPQCRDPRRCFMN